MRYLTVLFWSLLLGQITTYIGAQLSHTTYDFNFAVIGSLIVALAVFIISGIIGGSSKEVKK